MRIITIAILCTFLVLTHSKFTNRLATVLETKRARAAENPIEHNVWVMFNDKGNNPQRIYPCASAIARRQRNGFAAYDYAVSENFVHQIQQLTKATIRSKSAWFNAISLGGVTKSELEAISKLDFVSELDLVTTFTRAEPTVAKKSRARSELDYGSSSAQLRQINVLEAHNLGLTGANITIGVLDSGFRLTHNAYKKLKVKATYDFINNDTNVDNEAGQDVAAQYEHGTMTLSLIGGQDDGKFFGSAFDAQFLLAKTEDWSGERIIEEDYFARGMEWIERNGADIAT
jgi:subtilisin family serine protease